MLYKITSVGEILWDIYPEAKRLGGAPFNFIYHVRKLTGRGNFISSVGNDEYGAEILKLLRDRNFPTDYILIDGKYPTGNVKVRLNNDKIPKFTISEKCSYDFIELNSQSEKLIDEETDLIYFGTLSQRSEVTRSTIGKLFNKKKNFFCDLNLRHEFFDEKMIKEVLTVSNVVKINDDELKKIKNILSLKEDGDDLTKNIFEKFSIDLICVTKGSDGAVLYAGKSFSKYKTHAINIIDTVGAGDAFAAILALGYLKKMKIEKINLLANEFAADICLINGAIPVNDLIYNKYKREFENDS